MYGRNLINRSVAWISVPRFGCDDGPPWTGNISVPIPHCRVGGTVEPWAWGDQPGGRYGGVDVSWHGAVPDCPSYLPRSPDNLCTTSRRVRDDLLWELRLARAQSLSDSRKILRDKLVNWTDCALDDLWDEPAPQ